MPIFVEIYAENKFTRISAYFCPMETQRQKKISGVIQKDIVDILQRAAIDGGLTGILISVSKVNVTTDLSIAKVYLSIFPNKDAKELIKGIQSNQPLIKHELAQRTKHQLRRVPELLFYLDDSLDYIENIEKSLKREENPIENRELLEKRKKK
ncbi:ribosome-binding factor A [Maribacter polysiphoniae]|uniref:Ribosome-binding factor A n=2 Tax=Maribacter polysiphoniae TaxID=429344 RepID=A0A316E4D3_9FLAO|nr:ribosome-binding factor A [Maribacter polysiphoniae]